MLNALQKRLDVLRNDRFLRAAGVLVGGTATAQIIGLLALPLLTRFYSPEDFSLLAVYIAFLTISAAVTCMRLDTAIPLSENDDDAANLLALALSSTTLVIMLSGLIVCFFGSSLAAAVGRPDIEPHLWLVPFGIGLMGLYSSFQFMAIHQKRFKLIARTKITQALVGVGSQVSMGWAGVAPLGLMLGHALMSGAGVVALAIQALRRPAGGASIMAVSLPRMRQTLHTYRRYPRYSVAGELSNNAGIQLPILLIAAFFVGPEAGLLFLAMRAVGTPITIVGGAVSQVYYSNAAEYAREGTLAEETAKVVKRLSRMLVVPILIIVPLAPDLFRVAFGPEWERAGVIVIMILPWYALKVIASPISTVMYVRRRQPLMLMLALAGLVLRVFPLLAVLSFAPEQATVVFALTSAVFYGSIVAVFLAVAGLPVKALSRLIATEVALWGGVTAAAFFVLGVIGHA